MNPWLIHSLIAVFAIGAMAALYKVPSVRGHNKYAYSLFSFAVATLLSLFFFNSSIHLDRNIIIFSFLWGSGYALLTILQMDILKKLDTNASFPITSLASHILVVIIGISFFHDVLSVLQMIAILLTFVVVGFYNHANSHITFSNGLMPLALVIILISTFNKFIQKYGSISGEVNNFIFWQLFFAMIASIFLWYITHKSGHKENLVISRALIIWSVILGVLNFVGTAEIVKALSIGPFSLVYTINSFYILIASFIAWKFFGEKLTRQKILFIIIAIIAIILIKIG